LKLRTLTVLFGVVLVAGLLLAGAEDKYGVRVYDGAKYDAGASTFVAQMAGEASCYRTPDSVSKVDSFYSKLPGVTVVSTSAKGGMFKIGGVTVTVQSPWRDMKTQSINQDTLISIVKSKN